MTTIGAVLSMVFERIDRNWPDLKSESEDLKNLLELLRSPPKKFSGNIYKSNVKDVSMTSITYMIENYLEYREVVNAAAAATGGCKSRSLPSCPWRFSNFRLCKPKVSERLTELMNKQELMEYITKLYNQYDGWEPRVGNIANQLTPRGNDDINIVGMEKFVNMLKAHIRAPCTAARVVIGGMLGSGKSTIASYLLNQGKFDLRVWVTVSQAVDNSHVWENIGCGLLRHMPPDVVRGLETEKLMQHISVTTSTRKCLIVLDDVWSSTTDGVFWNTLRDYMPEASFIITTREKWVPNTFIDDDFGVYYEVPRLTVDEGMQLFRRYSGISDNTMVEVLDRCNGLPLAIIQAAIYEPNFQHQRELSSPEKISLDVVYPSYICLPNLKRLCLLYFGLFPLGQQIPLEKLYLLWMAEGMVVNKDQAEECLKDFADRNLVLVQEESGIRSCRPHDPVRMFCCLIGSMDKFLTGYRQMLINNVFGHRYALFLKDNTLRDVTFPNPDLYFDQRSLHVYGSVNNEISNFLGTHQVVNDLQHFKWMRTLDFNAIDFRQDSNKYFPQGIDKLLYLRYLGFRNCYLDELPLSFGNFLFLETLDLRVRGSSPGMIIPDTIGKLLKLRHLYFPVVYQTHNKQIKLKLKDLKMLEILENFHPGVCDVADLMEMTTLEIFTVTADGNCAPDLEKLVSVIDNSNQQHLRISSLTLVGYHCCTDRRIDLLTNFMARDSLKALHLEGPTARIPPISGNLTKIVFDGCEFTEDPMLELGGLLNLSVVVLCNNAIAVNKICCLRSSFKGLTSLKIANLQSLEKWDVRGGAMSNLSVLTIERCPKLPSLPNELVTISSLKKLEMGSMPEEFRKNVIDIFRASDRRSSGVAF